LGILARFEGEFFKLCKQRTLHALLTFTAAGLALGATILAPLRRNAAGVETLDLSGEDRILAALTAAFLAPVDAALLGKLRRACALWTLGEKSLAQIHLAQLRLPPVGADEALRLHLADRLMAEGFAPRELCKELGFALPAGLKKYSPDQPRDEQGRWTSGAGGGGSSSAVVSNDVREGRSVSPGGPHGGEDSKEDKLDAERRALGEEPPEEDQRHGRPIDPLGPTPLPVGTRPAAGGPVPADFVGQDFGKYGIGVENPDLTIQYSTRHALEREDREPLSREEIHDVVTNPLLVTRQSNSRFYFLNDSGAVVVDDGGRVVTNYRSSDFRQGVLDMLARIHSGRK
jgi:hypothetical protein